MIGSRHDMTDEQQQRIKRAIPKGLPGPPRKDDRDVTAGIFFVLRTGMPQRDLPEGYGPDATGYNALTDGESRTDSRKFLMIFKGLKKRMKKPRTKKTAAIRHRGAG